MLTRWTLAGFLALLVAAVAAPARGQEGGKSDGSNLELIQKWLKQVQEQTNKAFDKVAEHIGEVEKEIKVLKDRNTDLELSVGVLKERVDKLEQELAKLGGTTHASKSSPPPGKDNGFDDVPKDRKNKDTTRISQLLDRMTRLEVQLRQVQRDLNDLKKQVAATPPSDDKTLEEFRSRLELIEKKLTDLSAEPRISRSPPPSGRVALVNNTYEQLLFVVNGVPYRVNAGETKLLDPMPAGPITYEAISPTRGSRGQAVTMLVAGKQLTLTAQ